MKYFGVNWVSHSDSYPIVEQSSSQASTVAFADAFNQPVEFCSGSLNVQISSDLILPMLNFLMTKTDISHEAFMTLKLMVAK